jgi:hypothetical protein
MLKYILLICYSLGTVNGAILLYNTKVSDNRDYKDCLYSFTLNYTVNEWQLVPYCIRKEVADADDVDDQCHGDPNYTFEELKSKNVESHHLNEWNAPIDTINDYQKYLVGNDLSLHSHYYCNCSGKRRLRIFFPTVHVLMIFLADWFGARCQYSFDQFSKEMTFDKIITSQFQRKKPLNDKFEILEDPSFLTCYKGIQCDSAICLDWRQICDGSVNCKNAEDEPDECLLLETNECENDEYRCRCGSCIPKTFLIDFGYDCMDLSDEADTYFTSLVDYSCYSSPTLVCDFRLGYVSVFPCGDGQSIAVFSKAKTSCNNGRDLFIIYSLRKLASSKDSDTSRDISFECWHWMLCISGSRSTTIFGYDYDNCQCTMDHFPFFNSQCWDYFRKNCPASFTFEPEINVLYPFVRFLYQNRANYSSLWPWPSHFCYNQSLCRIHQFTGLPLIDGLMCVETNKIGNWPPSIDYIQFIFFSTCNIPHISSLADDRRLFYCSKSMKFISKFRVRDNIRDCFNHEDEIIDVTVMRTLNLTDRFKCMQSNQSFPRPIIGKGRCTDNSDTFSIDGCKIASDVGCQFLRGTYSPPIHYVFQENCNRVLKLKFTVENETDETNCDEWPIYPCNGYWDTSNGEDELNCPNTILSYITHTVFNCSKNEHYCAYRNRTMGCLSKERAGDGISDCLGGTDERATSCASSKPISPFNCTTAGCFPLSRLCDKVQDCYYPDYADEIMCPWLRDFQCRKSDFICKNGACLARTKQCDEVIDCLPAGEDEWFCDLDYSQTTQFFLDKIEEYPHINIDSLHLPIATKFQSVATSPVNDMPFQSSRLLKNWFCNRGIIVKKRASDVECFCPPSYYGSRCEYQAERLLITVRIDRPASLNKNQIQYDAIQLVACLMFGNTIVHHEQFLHVPLMKQMFYLNYPRPPPKQRGNWSVRLDAFSVTTSTVDFKASWLFDVALSFLPVNRLVLHLMLKDQDVCGTLTCIHGSCRKYLDSKNRAYCQCEENWSGIHCNTSTVCSCAGGGKCISWHPTPICVCPLGRIGNECRVLFNPCTNIKCEHSGTCLPLDERQLTKFICLCPNGYYGSRCELAVAMLDIHFSDLFPAYNRPFSAAVFAHFLELRRDSPGVLFVQNRLLHKQVPLNKPLRIFNNDHSYLPTFILLQIFFEPNNFHYYIAAVIKSRTTNIITTIYHSNRCPHVDELIFNETIREFPPIKKVKYYQHVCKMNSHINWFYDEAYLCFCYKDRLPDCLFFQRESMQCTTDYCQNNGQCVQNNFNGIWDFGCVCSGCAYGSLCQLTTSQYILSLDAMLGQDLLGSVSLTGQPALVKIVMAVVILMFSFGLVSNILSLMTFKQAKVREFGCGIYLLYLPFIGQLGLSIFVGRFFYLLGTQINHVNNRSATRWSCISLEYFLSVCPMLFDWLTACVAVERSVNIIKGVSFKKSDSVWWAKRITIFLTIVVLTSAWHVPLIHQLIDDPRAITLHTWCVVTFPWPWLKYYRLMINLINLIVPGSINLVATVFLLHKSTRMKQKFAKTQSEKSYFMSFKKQLPLYGSPFGLVILSLMRLIFSFTLVCIIHQWQKYVYLTAYFVSFAPLMGTFPIFVLPAEIYKTEFKNFIKRTRNNLRRTRI